MSESINKTDAMRDQNLRRMAQVLRLPERPDAARQERWQQVQIEQEPIPQHTRRWFMHQHPRIAFWTTAAAAAIAVIVVGLGFGHTERVSADQVFANLKLALRKSLAMRLEGIDLGNASIRGEIIMNRSKTGSDGGNEHYSELHVLLKASNHDWNDIDAVSVVCQTPAASWHFCRGNAGTISMTDHVLGRSRVTPTDYFLNRADWKAYLRDPIGAFGQMPLSMSFKTDDSEVDYSLPLAQRAFVRKVSLFMVGLGDSGSADMIVEQLRKATLTPEIEQIGPDAWVLRTGSLSQVPALIMATPNDREIADASRELIWDFVYDERQSKITGHKFDAKPEALSDVEFEIDWSAFEPHDGSLDEVAARLAAVCTRVERIAGPGSGETILRTIGVPIKINSKAVEWVRKTMAQLQSDMELHVHFGGKEQAVSSIEIRNIAGPSGRMILTVGETPLGEGRLNPERWTRAAAREANKPAVENKSSSKSAASSATYSVNPE